MERLRIGFFGGGPQALAGVRAIIEQPGWEVAFVHPRFENDPVVEDFAKPHGVEIMPFARPNDAEALPYLREKRPDIIVSINCRIILRQGVLASARLGGINLHNGLLPRQGGGGGAYAAIINGEPCGMTVHLMDEGIDSGDIIVQREITLSPDATMGDFQRKFIFATPELICAAINHVAAGLAGRPQKGLPFYYVAKKAPWDELIDWGLTSREIFDRVRARTPGPANFYLYDGIIHYVTVMELEPRVAQFVNTIGQVIQRDKRRGVLVKTGDTAIWITSVRVGNQKDEIVPSHPIGTMLGQNIHLELYEMKRRIAALEARLAARES